MQASSLKETPPQADRIPIKIRIVFIELNWIFKNNSRKSVFFRLLLFSFVVVVVVVAVVVVVISKEGQLVRLYRDILISFFKNCVFVLFFLTFIEEKRPRFNTGEQFRSYVSGVSNLI